MKEKYNYIIYKISDGVAEIKLNRTEVLNSFNYEMADELIKSFEDCKVNNKVRAVVLTGNGRAFCAGQDLEEATKEDGPSISEIIDHTYNPIVKRITELNKPVICYVNGVAAGAGANLAICCDITFAAKSAKFVQSFINIGLVPDSGGTYYLPRNIGKQKAAGLMFSGDKLSAEEAEKIGMIYKAVEDDNGYKVALDFATRLSLMPTKSIGLIKELLYKSDGNNLSRQLEFEKQQQSIAAGSKDYKEGVNAFLEKRKPDYIGE